MKASQPSQVSSFPRFSEHLFSIQQHGVIPVNQQTPLDVWASVPFSDSTEMQDAIRDPRYSSYVYPNRYREAVEAKIGISEGVGTDNAQSITPEGFRSTYLNTESIVDGSVAEEQRAAQAADLEAFKNSHGPMATAPAAPAAPQKPTQPNPHDHRETGRGY